MPTMEIAEKEALTRLLERARGEIGYVAVARIEGRAAGGRKKERQIGRVDCPEPQLLGRVGRIIRDAVQPGTTAQLRVRRYDADGQKIEQLVEVTRPSEPSIRDRLPAKRTAQPQTQPAPGPPSEESAAAARGPGAASVGIQPAEFSFLLAEVARLNSDVLRLTAELARRDIDLARRDAESVRLNAKNDRQDAEVSDLRAMLGSVQRERDVFEVRLHQEIAARAEDGEQMAAQLEELNEMMESTPSWASLLR